MGLILDIVILVLLATTVFFAARLSLHLKTFRDSRKEFDKLLQDLSSSIVQAEGAITGLRRTAKESGTELQSLVNEARALSEELQIMGEAGDSLAGRLEKLAERNGRIVHSVDELDDGEEEFPRRTDKPFERKPVFERNESRAADKKAAGFAIRDPEFDRGEAGVLSDSQDNEAQDEEEAAFAESFHSRAERELYEALLGGERKTGAGGRS